MKEFQHRVGLAISVRKTDFAPVLFAGRVEEGLEVCGHLGFGVVELSLRSARDIELQPLASMLEKNHLGLAAISTGQACLLDGRCLSSSDPAARRGAAQWLSSAVELAAEFGASVIVGGIRGRLAGAPAEREAQRDWAVEALRDCARRATDLGVTLVVEPINRYETNFVNTVDEALGLVEELGEPSAKLLLDTFHMNIEERSMEDAVRTAGESLGYLHVSDSNRRAPGQGHLDFCLLLDALEEIAYQGMLVSEILPLPDDRWAAQLTAEFWRRPRADRRGRRLR